jgi:hypothetical protein
MTIGHLQETKYRYNVSKMLRLPRSFTDGRSNNIWNHSYTSYGSGSPSGLRHLTRLQVPWGRFGGGGSGGGGGGERRPPHPRMNRYDMRRQRLIGPWINHATDARCQGYGWQPGAVRFRRQ